MAATPVAARDVFLPELPAGYELRGFRPGDQPGWVELLTATGFGGWTTSKLDEYLALPERLEGSRAIECDGRLVAATFASQRRLDPPKGALDYVVCHPDHQGLRLGRIVCAAVTRHLVTAGYDNITLLTDDWRLAALRTYFYLGFQPVMTRVDMPARWLKVRQQLRME